MVQAKLRGCCDGCTKSKLKCSGEMPSCQRCRIRSLDCVYSKARRAGRLRLKPKPSKASIVCSVDREPRIDLTSYSGQPFNGVQCSKSELALPSLPDFVHYSPDSQDISVLMQDPWASTPRFGSGVTQPSSVCDFDDLMLQDMLLNRPEGFGSASAMTLKQEWRHDNTLFRDGLEDPCPGHGATSQGPPGHTSSSPSGFYTVTIQNTDGTNGYLTEVDMEINAIMATITDIAKRPIGSYHLDDHPCVTSWPQLLSKAQLLMYIAGSKSSFSLRLDAVLQVLWAAEQVQKRISECPTCMPRGMELSSMLALLYDWISSRIADALENAATIQSCCLTVGNSTLTGQNGIVGIYELVKCRITRAIHVIRSMNNTNSSIGEGDPGRLYPVARLMLEVAKSQLEAILGMIDLLESEQYCSI